jgi:hypothetical protein
MIVPLRPRFTLFAAPRDWRTFFRKSLPSVMPGSFRHSFKGSTVRIVWAVPSFVISVFAGSTAIV